MNSIPWEALLQRLDVASDSVSTAAKQGVEFIWPLAVKQELSGGVITTLVSLLVIVSAIFVIKKVISCIGSDKWRNISQDGYHILIMFPFIVTAFVAMPFLVNGIHRLINPEWHALINVVNMIK